MTWVAGAVTVLALLELLWNVKLTAENERLRHEASVWQAEPFGPCHTEFIGETPAPRRDTPS